MLQTQNIHPIIIWNVSVELNTNIAAAMIPVIPTDISVNLTIHTTTAITCLIKFTLFILLQFPIKPTAKALNNDYDNDYNNDVIVEQNQHDTNRNVSDTQH